MKNFRVHRLVAEAFIPNLNELPCINHKDENRKNNHFKNLEWCTYSYNNTYGNRLEKFKNTKNKEIYQYELDGSLIKVWESIKQAAEHLNISNSGIVTCAKGKFKQFKGYIWRYNLGGSNE